MQLIDLVELAGEDWSRRWVRIRAFVLVAAVLVAPGVVVRGVEWYAHERAVTITRQITHLPALPTATDSH